IPAEEEHLGVARAYLFLEAVPVGGADLELHVDPGELPAVPVETRGIIRPPVGRVEVEYERLPGLRVAPFGIARLGEKLARGRDALAPDLPLDAVVNDGVEACDVLAIAEDARR